MFNNNSWQSPYDWNSSTPYAPRMHTNVIRVTSLEEAIMKSNVCNSETVYFNQDRDEFYIIRIDLSGNKTWQTFVYNVPNLKTEAPVTRDEYNALVARVTALEPKEVSNAEPNG